MVCIDFGVLSSQQDSEKFERIVRGQDACLPCKDELQVTCGDEVYVQPHMPQ
jgi:hypothetical protein